jgi:hypothetical protein
MFITLGAATLLSALRSGPSEPAALASLPTVPFRPPERLPERLPKKAKRQCRVLRRFNATLRGAVFCIDWMLRRWYGVHAFSSQPDDLLRIAVKAADHALVLPDGTHVAAGDMILDLHIWNERILGLGTPGSTLAWASRVRRRVDRSLTALAAHIESDPSLRSCKALHAETVFVAGRGATRATRIAARLGLSSGTGGRPAALGETLVGFGLAWACNPHSLRGKPFKRSRNELWISCTAFIERYCAAHEERHRVTSCDGAGSGSTAARRAKADDICPSDRVGDDRSRAVAFNRANA